MSNRYRNIWNVVMEHRVIISWMLAFAFFILSFVRFDTGSIGTETKAVQKKLLSREALLEKYIERAFDTPADQWPQFEDFPDDMVLYKYVADTLQCWCNLFPVSNDEMDLYPSWYRIHDLNSRNVFNTPLTFLMDGEQYVNLGSTWYVVITRREGESRIIAGLEVKTEYLTQNSILKNSTNRHIGLRKGYTAVPVYLDAENAVYGLSGEPLFSIASVSPLPDNTRATSLRWLTFLFAVLAMLAYQAKHSTLKSMIFSLAGMAAVNVGVVFLVNRSADTSEIFSPMLYADGNIFNSLGVLLVTNVFIFLYIFSIFLGRKPVYKAVRSSRPWLGKLWLSFIALVPVCVALYTHFSLRSLILNSNIEMELFRINAISVYTILVYASYTLLFLSLLMSCYVLYAVSGLPRRFRKYFFLVKPMIAYVCAVSVYMTVFVSYFSFKRECETLGVWTNQLAVERDLSLEMQLRSIEGQILLDPLIRRLVGIPNTENMVMNRLVERYFWNILRNYDLRTTICGVMDMVPTEEYPRPVNCLQYFKDDVIEKYGIPLAGNSAFYYLDYFRDKVSYIGAFSVLRRNQRFDLYIEIDSKEREEDIGYPSLLIDGESTLSDMLAGRYSMAKYNDNRLTMADGFYSFPVYFETSSLPYGFSYRTADDMVTFYNRLSNDNLIVLTRPDKKFWSYLMSFSYQCLFLALVVLLASRSFRRRINHIHASVPKRSLSRNITILIVASMVVSLVAMGIGSVSFIVQMFNGNNRVHMEEKLATVQSTLTKMCRNYNRYNEINTLDMFNAMDLVSKNTRVDINLYDPLGRLIRTTKPEVFDQYLVSSRMNPEAYKALVIDRKMQVIQEEHIASLGYYSLYSPIYNDDGVLLAIANIPYFVNNSNLSEDAPSIIAAIVNIYILLLIVSVLGGVAVSKSISNPLRSISRNMQEMSVSHRTEKINYKANDELGMLISAYNQMIDALDESTRKLARSEREQAWREMARQIAHEIKNPLTPMKLSIQHLIRLKKQNVPQWQERFDALAASLIEQIDILSNTASEFSSFAKFYNEEIVVVDLVAVINEQLVLFDNKDNILISFVTGLEKAETLTRKSQITRALVNIISNAVQAVEYGEEGRIRISLVTDGDYFRIDVEDNGPGVSQENLDRLFSPNFTTKSGGTGLGLAICKNIVDQSGGEISYCKSEDLGGADFVVKLPVYKMA